MSKDSQLETALRTGRFTEAPAGSGEPCTAALLLKKLLLLQRSPLHAHDSLQDAIASTGKVTLTQPDANVLYFCDQLFQLCQLKAEIDPSIMERFIVLRPVVAAVILQHGLTALLQHPLCKLLDRLWYASLYWTPSLGKPGDKYKARIEEMLQRIHTTNPARASYANWQEEFAEQLDKEFQRAELLATRISQAERDSWVRKQARQIVQYNVNRILRYADMPETVELLLKGPWRDSLHQVLLSHGMESLEWHNLLRLAEYLLDSVQSPENDKEQKNLYKLIPKIPGMLRKQLFSIGNQETLQEWVSAIEALHMSLLMGNTIPVRPAEPLALALSETLVNASISSALVDKIAHIHEGQWLVYHDENDEPLLCRLTIKLEEAGQLLFVNVLGAKCLQKSFSEFAYLLAAKHVYLLNTDTNFSQCVHDTINQFVLMHRFHTLLQADESERRKREIVRAKTEAERRQRAQEKARQEAERLARMRKEAEKRARLTNMEAALVRAKEKTLHEVQALAVGAWIDMHVAGTRQKCKLAAIINNGDKLILTDRDGIKLAEFSRGELTSLVMDGKAVIVENGHRFEDSLEKMIQTLRKT